MFDENVAGSRKISSISARRDTTTPMPSTGITGIESRRALKTGCGFAAISGSIAANGLVSGGVVSSTVSSTVASGDSMRCGTVTLHNAAHV